MDNKNPKSKQQKQLMAYQVNKEGMKNGDQMRQILMKLIKIYSQRGQGERPRNGMEGRDR